MVTFFAHSDHVIFSSFFITVISFFNCTIPLTAWYSLYCVELVKSQPSNQSTVFPVAISVKRSLKVARKERALAQWDSMAMGWIIYELVRLASVRLAAATLACPTTWRHYCTPCVQVLGAAQWSQSWTRVHICWPTPIRSGCSKLPIPSINIWY